MKPHGKQILRSSIPPDREDSYFVATGTNAYAVTISNVSLQTNPLSFRVKFTNANTGASTLNVNTIGAVALVNNSTGGALASGDLPAGSVMIVVHDGTNYRVIGLAGGSAPPGTFTVSEAEIDFGTKPVTSKSFTVVDASIVASSKIMVVGSGNTATGRVGNDYEWDSVNYTAKGETGTFTLKAVCNSGHLIGKRKILYTYS